MFAYTNSKFVYMERHMRSQINTLYQDVIMQRCELEKQVIQNTLSLATILPDEFAYRLMKSRLHDSHCWKSNTRDQVYPY